ncbi:VIT family protein [Lactiplantibacillus garii]|uniref:VIT family protein n=1 Tax=Lactiplantibacillus garii TaxID=2306423 RepID=A0A3R8J9D9_9LACO|nr:VIT1/CCC1 transporter family protein [Lactiplantibacillus garii]RRK11467.1 VIT family protein [Lactiplantibacillus garii]
MEFSIRRVFKHGALADRLNVIRAGILGANDGIISVSGIVLGAMGASFSSNYLLMAGLAGMLAGACSMAGGEYISVRAQHDIQKNTVDQLIERVALPDNRSRQYLIQAYRKRGLSLATATTVADELMSKQGRQSEVDAEVASEYQLQVGHYLNPLHAAVTSFLSFIAGAIIPLVTMTTVPNPYKEVGTLVAMVVALGLNGFISSRSQVLSTKQTMVRNVVVGLLTTVITFGLGAIFHTSIGG